MEVNMLKKIALTLALLAFAANAFATAVSVSGGSGWPTAITFVPSKSVTLGYLSGYPTGVTTGNFSVYSIASKNSAGDKIYATTSASTAIVQSIGIAGSALVTGNVPNLPNTTSDSTIGGGAGNWTVM